MITMNSTISIKMTLTEAHLLRSHLFIEKFESKTDTGKEVIEKLLNRVENSLNNLSFEENEKIVDEINDKTERES